MIEARETSAKLESRAIQGRGTKHPRIKDEAREKMRKPGYEKGTSNIQIQFFKNFLRGANITKCSTV